MDRCFIVASGTIPSECRSVSDIDAYLPNPSPGDLVIVADGGYTNALALGLEPDILVGDFDSLFIEREKINPHTEIISLKTEKSHTDSWEAAQIGADREYRDFILLGMTGNRLDHTMNNMLLLKWLAVRGLSGKIVDKNNIISILGKGEHSIPYREGYRLSMIPLTKNVKFSHISGLQYTPRDNILTRSDSIGISNEFVDGRATIIIVKGWLYLFLSRD